MSSPHGSCEVDELIFDFVKFESPCGTPVLTSFSLSHFLSRHIAALQLERKDCTHFTMGTGMCSLHRVSIRYEWGIVSKNPVMSNISMVTARSWFQVASMLCIMAITASCADLTVIPPY